ncbi:MAG: three-helix bundle dimerization domain-containing protein [Mycobacterium sp.]
MVRDVHARYNGRPLCDFVPSFVERNAGRELSRFGATG